MLEFQYETAKHVLFGDSCRDHMGDKYFYFRYFSYKVVLDVDRSRFVSRSRGLRPGGGKNFVVDRFKAFRAGCAARGYYACFKKIRLEYRVQSEVRSQTTEIRFEEIQCRSDFWHLLSDFHLCPFNDYGSGVPVKRIFSGVALALLPVILFLCSCSRPKSPLDASTIILWEQEDAQVAPYIDSVLAAFKKLPENKAIRVVRTHYQTEDLRSQFQSASLAGVAPDLIMCPSDTAGLFAVSGFIRPVDGLIDASKYNKTVIQAITLDGKIWGVPVSNGNHLMLFFNRKYSKTAPKDTDELFKFCAAEAKAYKLDFCMAFDMGEPFWLMPWLAAFGGWPIDNKTPALDTPAMRSAINFYLDLKYNRKYAPPECDYNCMDSLFKEGKTAFIINGDWAISGYQQYFKKDLGLGLMPKVSSTGLWPAPMVSGKYFMISSGVKPEKLAVLQRFMEFYTNRDNQIRQFKELQRLPALAEAFRAPEITGAEIARVSMEQISKGRPMSMATEMRAIWDSARNYLGLATSRKLSVEDATRKMQENAAQKISEMNR